MNEIPASSPDQSPESTPPPQQVPLRVALPSLPPTVTYAIIALTVTIFLLQFLSIAVFGYPGADPEIDWLEVYGARFNQAIRMGELWRFITPVFLHSRSNLLHIFFNMYALLSIGSFLERQFGHARFTLLYFLGGFAGNVFSFLLTGEQGYSIGASTAVFGLVAAQAIFFYQNRKLFGGLARQAIMNSVVIIGINLFIGLAPGIDNWGHVGGLLGGAMFAWFASPLWDVVGGPPQFHLRDRRGPRDTAIGVVLVLSVFSLLAVYGHFSF